MNKKHLSPKYFNSITYFAEFTGLGYLPADKNIALKWFKNGIDLKKENADASIGTFYVDGKMGGGDSTAFICIYGSNLTNIGDGGFWLGTDTNFMLQRQTMSLGQFTDSLNAVLRINITNPKTPQIVDMAKLFKINNCKIKANQRSGMDTSTGYHSIGIPNNNYTEFKDYKNGTFKDYIRDVVNDLPEIKGGEVIQYRYSWTDILSADEIKIATDKGWTLA